MFLAGHLLTRTECGYSALMPHSRLRTIAYLTGRGSLVLRLLERMRMGGLSTSRLPNEVL